MVSVESYHCLCLLAELRRHKCLYDDFPCKYDSDLWIDILDSDDPFEGKRSISHVDGVSAFVLQVG